MTAGEVPMALLNRHRDDDPEALVKNMHAEIQAYAKNAPQFDDLTMLALQWFGINSGWKGEDDAAESSGYRNQEGNDLFLALTGQLNTKTAPKLKQVIEQEADETTNLNFDFKGLDFLTSAGLRVLLFARQKTEDSGTEMKLQNVSDEIMGIFKLTGFAAVLKLK